MKKGLSRLPTLSDLESAYECLIHSTSNPSELGLYSQWSRLDPRLAEIWVDYVSRKWAEINPMSLREELVKLPWPSAAAVLLEFVKKKVPAQHFRHWTRLVTEGFSKAIDEQFFIGLRQLGGALMFEDARYASLEYRRWGFLDRENLVGKTNERPVILDYETRTEILKELLNVSKEINVVKYWNAVGRCISRRQAERDLRANHLLRARGYTRAKLYRVKKDGI